MKAKTSFLLILFFFTFGTFTAWSQCEPMGPEECPDPENNGEICPDTLAIGIVGQPYSQVATILVPDTDTTGVPLHHFTLVAVDNLPPGLNWESNAPDNEFLAGNYYCILLDGTPTEAGIFPLKIVVDIYIDFFGNPLYVMTITDSTSLSIEVLDNTGIINFSLSDLLVYNSYPNPFSTWTNIRYYVSSSGEVSLNVYSLVGEMVHQERKMASKGDNSFLFNGSKLAAGTYIYILRTEKYSARSMMVRSR